VIQQQLGNYGNTIGVGSNAVGAVGQFGANAVTQENAMRNAGADAQAQAKLIRAGIAAQNRNNFGKVATDAVGMFAPGGGGFNWAKAF
jgi:hypothetical protein